jgi:hypothetical protein
MCSVRIDEEIQGVANHVAIHFAHQAVKPPRLLKTILLQLLRSDLNLVTESQIAKVQTLLSSSYLVLFLLVYG